MYEALLTPEWVPFMLFLSGVLAGASNAAAGGGTFFTFPVFIAAGVPPVVANASNAVAVWPGHALAVIAYRKELKSLSSRIKSSMLIALLGGISGAVILIYIGNHTFVKLIPFLLLFAVLLLAFGNRLIQYFNVKHDYYNPSLGTRIYEYGFAVYGGFFGAGLGVMLMASLQMLGIKDAQIGNALKNLLASVVTSVAVIIFTLSGLVSWTLTFYAFIGAVVGGVVGAKVAKKLPAATLKRVVIAFGIFLTVYYFAKYY